MKYVRWIVIACLLTSVTLAACELGRKEPPRPDILFITIDTLRPDHLSFYGYESETAPFLAKLAKRSTVFTRAVSTSSWTAPSTASLFSGQYPTKHGVIEGMAATFRRLGTPSGPIRFEINRIPSHTSTLPEILHENGYRTFGLGANPNIGAEIGFSRGFDRFERVAPIDGMRHASAGLMYRVLADWVPLVRNSQPYFVYLHFNDPHLGTAVHLKRDFVQQHELKPAEQSKRESYDAQIRYLDGWLAKTFEALEVDDDTLVVFVSDHGEALGEHGRGGHLCCSLHREVHQILMMWSAPGLGIKSQSVDVNTSLVDVLPTLLDVAGIDASIQSDGRSLKDLLRGEADPRDRSWLNRPLLAHRAEPRRNRESWAIVRNRYKLINDEGTLKLYDISADPQELTNLAERNPELVTRLVSDLDELKKGPETARETAPVELSPGEEEQLRALGYLRD